MSGEVPESGRGQSPTDPPAAVLASNASIHVFISYASYDVAVADAIVEALERHGLKCWIAPRDVKAGALYADSIVRAISGAKAVVVVLSESAIASSHVGKEVERASSKKRAIIALRVDAAPLTPALEYFLSESQWVEAQARNMEAAYSRLIDAIREPERTAPGIIPAATSGTSAVTASAAHPKLRNNLILLAAGIAVVVVALAAPLAEKFWLSKRPTMEHTAVPVAAVASGAAPAVPTAPSFNPPAHSIAVLPFVNMSGDKEQEYFSDGLTEELLNSLAEIDGLQVAARTSSFSFKEHPDIATVAHKLNVGAVLEGSVRRSANTIRITAQLINAVTGFHLWSKTYDRDLGDVLKLQTEIATAVTSALKVTLLGDVAAKVELGGTRNPGAFDAYLRGAKAFSSRHEAKDLPAAIAAYTEAIRLDPHYALAFAARSIALSNASTEATTVAAMREGFDKAQADARQALVLTPDLAEAHLALAVVSEVGNLDFTQASEAYERALALSPGNAQVLQESGVFAAWMGHFDAALAAARRAVVLDPLARQSHGALADALYAARRYKEAVAAYAEVISLEPDSKIYGFRGLAFYGLGDLQSARAACETQPDDWRSQWCLSVVYDKLGRHADAEAELAKLRAVQGDASAYQYATIYAQWGRHRAQALEWLDTSMRLRDPGLENLKTDPLMDPLRKEPRFQTIERELKFPT